MRPREKRRIIFNKTSGFVPDATANLTMEYANFARLVSAEVMNTGGTANPRFMYNAMFWAVKKGRTPAAVLVDNMYYDRWHLRGQK